MIKSLIALAAVVAVVSATNYFEENFNDGKWEDRWVYSTVKESEGTAGKFAAVAGKWNDDSSELGLQTSEDARFYQLSAGFDDFSNDGKDLVVQFSAKHEQKIDCGGGYIKLMPAGLDQKQFDGESPYNIMFGPDICGATKRVHVIFNYKGENYLIKKTIPCKTDQLTHVYTLIVKPDQSYDVLIDNESVESGSLIDDWDFLPPREIPDPDQSKPEDWVDNEYMDDPEDVKPEDWDVPAEIVDPDAEQPDDWDTDLDGEWEAPLIPNPDFKGAWHPRQIKNPDYKGPWEHPQIANPDFEEDTEIYKYESNAFVGFELWQVKAGTIFDSILVTDSIDDAKAAAQAVIDRAASEKALFDKEQEEEAAKAEEERLAREAELEALQAQEAEDEEEEEEEDVHDEL